MFQQLVLIGHATSCLGTNIHTGVCVHPGDAKVLGHLNLAQTTLVLWMIPVTIFSVMICHFVQPKAHDHVRTYLGLMPALLAGRMASL
jgi:hypothetical protein